MSTKLDKTKKVVKFIVGMSTAWTVCNVISNNVNTEDKTIHKVEAFVGGAVVGSMVADAAEDHISKKIDDIAAYFKSDKDEVSLNLIVP